MIQYRRLGNLVNDLCDSWAGAVGPGGVPDSEEGGDDGGAWDPVEPTHLSVASAVSTQMLAASQG